MFIFQYHSIIFTYREIIELNLRNSELSLIPSSAKKARKECDTLCKQIRVSFCNFINIFDFTLDAIQAEYVQGLRPIQAAYTYI